ELDKNLFFIRLLNELKLWSSIYQDTSYHNAYHVLVNCLSRVFFLWQLPIDLSDFLLQFQTNKEYTILSTSDNLIFQEMGLKYLKYLEYIPTQFEKYFHYDDILGYRAKFNHPIKIQFNNIQNNPHAYQKMIAKINKLL